MFNIVCVGKIKEKYLREAVDEYIKRISGYTNIRIIEVKEVNIKTPFENMKEEGKNILKVISPSDLVITLEIKGKMLDSVELSHFLQDQKLHGKSNITFVIGGSNGLDEKVLDRSDYALSFSKLTFPHQLMRVILLEQLYRSLTIENNQEYHK